MRRLSDEEISDALGLEDVVGACPAVVARITEVAGDPNATARDIADIIATDEGLTTRVLKLVNSAFFGLAGRVSTVTQAAVILGMREVKSLVYSVPAGSLFAGIEPNGLDPTAVWDHSVMVGIIARELSYLMRYPLPEEVFVGGVIHDVGKAVLSKTLGEEYGRLLSGVRAGADDSATDSAAIEVESIGISHAEVGARLLERWSFPEILIEGVRYHHGPDDGGELKQVPALMFVADRLANMPAEASFTAALGGKAGEAVEGLRLTRRSVAEAYRKSAEVYEEVRQIFQF